MDSDTLDKMVAFATREMGRDMGSSRIHIANSAWWCYHYAIQALDCERFLEGEEAIMAHPLYCFWYARDVIKGRWKAAEKTLATDVTYMRKYKEMIIEKELL